MRIAAAIVSLALSFYAFEGRAQKTSPPATQPAAKAATTAPSPTVKEKKAPAEPVAPAAALPAPKVGEVAKSSTPDTDHESAPLPRDLASHVELARRGAFSLYMGGLIQVQGAFYAGEQVARQFGDAMDTEGFRVRRARLSFSGDLLPNFGYYLAVDLKDAIGAAAGGDVGNEVLDATITWRRYAWLQISAGVDRVPFSTFTMISSSRLELAERPLSVDLLAPNRRVGVSVSGKLAQLRYALGLYNGSNGVTSGNRLAGMATAARVGFLLFDRQPEFVPRRFQLYMGAAYMFDDQEAVTLHRASGSLQLSAFRMRLTSEFLWEHSSPDDQPVGIPDAGEVNRWAAIAELSGFVWRDLLQLSLRYEYFSDNEDLPTFGKQQLISMGVNAYLHEHRLKLQLNYVRRHELDGPELKNDIALAQLQAMF